MQAKNVLNPSVQTAILAPTRDEFETGFSLGNMSRLLWRIGTSSITSMACHTDTDRNRKAAKFEILSPMYSVWWTIR
ncbi:hypothetical protein EMPG_17518 [Blastomyces silverae]|uniref:Uncharacterized protein n=1 Tax=Blastomyces silverae TaxID=2060906 RepID=A0A0H1B6H9_9EURO|nr:hypothetical protein EMPG_17518 [Blastomyces silverae]